MSIGSWDPESATAPALSEPLQQRFIDCAGVESAEQLAPLLTAQELAILPSLMQLDHDACQRAVQARSDDELEQLIRFFAVAEKLPACEAGAQSPAIAIASLLRERGRRLDRDLLRWLRRVSDNRFLPYGPL